MFYKLFNKKYNFEKQYEKNPLPILLEEHQKLFDTWNSCIALIKSNDFSSFKINLKHFYLTWFEHITKEDEKIYANLSNDLYYGESIMIIKNLGNETTTKLTNFMEKFCCDDPINIIELNEEVDNITETIKNRIFNEEEHLYVLYEQI